MSDVKKDTVGTILADAIADAFTAGTQSKPDKTDDQDSDNRFGIFTRAYEAIQNAISQREALFDDPVPKLAKIHSMALQAQLRRDDGTSLDPRLVLQIIERKP